MIITQTPLRIGLLGGGTDLPGYYREHGGRVLRVLERSGLDHEREGAFDVESEGLGLSKRGEQRTTRLTGSDPLQVHQ